MPSILTATFPSVLGRMLDMPLSVLLCALEMCFLTVNHTHTPNTMPIINGAAVTRIPHQTPHETNLHNISLNMANITNMNNKMHQRPHHVQHVQRRPPATVLRIGTPSDSTPVTAPAPVPNYANTMTDRMDAINIDHVLKNTRLVNSFVKCMLDKGPCTAEGREMKREMLEVLQTACTKCGEKTKTRLKKTFHRMKSDPQLRESYKKVLSKYDPDKKYIANLEKFLIN